MNDLLLIHATLIDGNGADPVPDSWVRIENGRIRDIGAGAHPAAVKILDCAGRALLPGLIDCHTHLAAVDFLNQITHYSQPLLAAKTLANMRDALGAGYTTVRDAGFTDIGFREVVASGAAPGPRMYLASGPLSQTGGHSDFRSRHDSDPQDTDGLFHPGVLVDGVDQCRRGAREILRRGADQIKVMASGGCTSPTDDVRHPQFTVEELRAVVYEARVRDTYVMAHAYTPTSIMNCMDAGVRTIEHGNDIDEAAAAAVARTGAYVVPTIATYELMARDGACGGMPADQIEMVERVLKSAYTSLEILVAAGAKIGSGSDVLGIHQPLRSRELEFKSRILGPLDTITATTRTNAEILGRGSDLGTIDIGKIADLIIVDGDPLDDITVLAHTDRIHYVIAAGQIAVTRDPALDDSARWTDPIYSAPEESLVSISTGATCCL